MHPPALLVSDLVKDYVTNRTTTRAVDGISLTLERGQVLALLGPNGAGKTTTLEICEGFRDRDAGTVQVLGLDPRTHAADLKPRVGVMLQDGVGAYTAATAFELLSLFGTYAAHPQDPYTLLDALGLREVSARPVKRLSGGQQQRLSLALSLVARPELVFLDEAEHLADIVCVIDHGRVVASGSPAELTRSGSEEQIRVIVPSGLDAAALQNALPGGHLVRETIPGHYLVTGGSDPQVLVAVTAWCAERDVRIESLAVDRRSLEDVFLDLTGREVRA